MGVEKSKAKTLADWQKSGVRRLNGQGHYQMLILMRGLFNLMIITDVHTLMYGNYQSLLNWNRSHYFALAVSHLADQIR